MPEGYSKATAAASPELRADGVRAVIAAADVAGVLSYGSFSTATETLGIANTHGIRAAGQRTISQLLTVAMAPDGGSGYAESAAVDVSDIDAAEIGRQAAEKARATGNPVAVDPGEWPVILEEYAVVDLLSMLGYMGFSALAVQEERSFSEPGRKVGSELVSIVDDGTDPATLPMAFDYEGVAKERVTLVDRGVCRDVVYDAQTAARAGRMSTGHGLPAPNPYGPFPLSMAMAAGETPREDLVAGMERGLLVTRIPSHEPGPPEARDRDRHDSRRDVLRRGWPDQGPGPEPPVHPELPRGACRNERGEPRAADAQGRLRRGAGAGDPCRQLELHGRHGALTGGMTDIWVCGSCHSLNRQRSKRCYKCGAEQEVAATGQGAMHRQREAIATHQVIPYKPTACAEGGDDRRGRVRRPMVGQASPRSRPTTLVIEIDRIRAGADPSPAVLDGWNSPSLPLALTNVGVVIFTLLFFGAWLSRTVGNVPALGGGVPSASPARRSAPRSSTIATRRAASDRPRPGPVSVRR